MTLSNILKKSESELAMTKDLAKILSQRVQRIKPSPTLMVSARAEQLQAEGKNILNLGVGEPDFDTPLHIKEAAIKAIVDGKTKYTVVEGILSLRKAICEKFQRDNRLTYQPSQVLISCGAKHSIFNLLAAILNEGDEVIIPAPFWVSYPDIVKLNDGVPVIVKTEFSQNFKMTPAQLQAAITPQTRALILNSPSNPTGMAYTFDEWRALGDVLVQYPNIFIMTDDIYEHILWNHTPFTNILNVCPELTDRCVVVNGVAKAYAMTGWRIGYAAGPSVIINAMKKVQSQCTSNACTISQYAALAALSEDQACVRKMNQAYHERHNYLFGELSQISGFTCSPSDGTFYTFPSIKGFCKKDSKITNDVEFAEFLLTKAEIAVVPGSAFGGPGHIRISFATSMENLREAIARIKQVGGCLD